MPLLHKNSLPEKAAAKLMLDTPNKNHRNRLPLWQLEKMRNIIQEQWEEVPGVAVTRNNPPRSLHKYLESPQRNLEF